MNFNKLMNSLYYVIFVTSGHQSYAKGTDVYHKVMEQFGDAILTIDGEIDRKALGAKVFSDKVIYTMYLYMCHGSLY